MLRASTGTPRLYASMTDIPNVSKPREDAMTARAPEYRSASACSGLEADESNARVAGGASLESGALGPLSRDHEVGVLEGREAVDDVIESLDRLEPADEEEIGPLADAAPTPRGRPGIAHEAGNHLHVAREAELAMLRAAEARSPR